MRSSLTRADNRCYRVTSRLRQRPLSIPSRVTISVLEGGPRMHLHLTTAHIPHRSGNDLPVLALSLRQPESTAPQPCTNLGVG